MASNLPDYVASAQPVPQENRMPWYKGTAQTYAGIMLWFVFWENIPRGGAFTDAAGNVYQGISATIGGSLSEGLGIAFIGLVLAAFICHFLYYVVPGMLGMKTGLPLYIVGTSTYGVSGGFLMPGLIMGLLQFGWLSVNAYFTSLLLVAPFCGGFAEATGSVPHMVVGSVIAVLAALLGVKGIQYVAKAATFLPLIPLVILLVLFGFTMGGLGDFEAKTVIELGGNGVYEEGGVTEMLAAAPLDKWGVISMLLTVIIGFFATAGAAGTDFGMGNRNARDVQLGGLVGITLAVIVTGGLSLLIVAGAYGQNAVEVGNPLMKTTDLMGNIVPEKVASVFMWLLAIAAFPAACFSSFIAANSFKTVLPKINPLFSVGAGTLVTIGLIVTGVAGNAIGVFSLVGASFGPICGAMAADYLMSGRKWAGPRAGFNMAGWISWAVGFAVGIAPNIIDLLGDRGFIADPAMIKEYVAVPPLSAFVVGFVLYYVLSKIGLQSRTLEMPVAAEAPAAESTEEPTEKPAEE